MRTLKFWPMAAMLAFELLNNSRVSYAQSVDREAVFGKRSPYITLSPFDRSGDLPSIGSSAFDKLFSKIENGQVVYDVPYPFDRLIDKFAGRTLPRDRYLTRLQKLGSKGELVQFLKNDLFIRESDELQDVESLFPFGRSLQKPRIGNAIKNPWKSPREVINLNLKRDPHLRRIGKIQDRLYCGHVEDLEMLECISWNSEAGRFEFQLVENYKEGQRPVVNYINRSKCLSCHQGGGPIFPRLSWLESDDSLALEAGLIWTHYGGDARDLQDPDVLRAFNDRVATSVGERQRSANPPLARFSRIKAGKFDRSVLRANQMMTANKLWVFLCGPSPGGDECRRTLFKAYLAVSLYESKRADEMTKALIKSELDLSRFEANFQKIKGSRAYDPFFIDRDPLTAIFQNEEHVTQCALGRCDFWHIERMINPENIIKLVKHGQHLSTSFNPRQPRLTRLVPDSDTNLDTFISVAKTLTQFFYRGQDPDDPNKGFYSDLGDWLNHQTPKPVDPDQAVAAFVKKVNEMDIRFFNDAPFSRERMLFGLWEGVDEQKASGFYRILTMKTPEKHLHKIENRFRADPAADPQLAMVTRVCVECHGTNARDASIPQFAYAENRDDLINKVFYHRENIISQLKSENMPPFYSESSLNAEERAGLIKYLQNLQPTDD